ncbi:MAG: heme NO-binding protein [Rhodobacteraceae bacterium]|nr:heme NO-binding protein [Paracoccaceae bacterium]
MHGLINRSIQCFLRDTYGAESWNTIAAVAELGHNNFEALLDYDQAQTEAVLGAAAGHLGSPLEIVLEDLGTYLVSHSNMHSLRRLLRFGGESFVDFLHSLDELHDRARMAVPDLSVPVLELLDHSSSAFTLLVRHDYPGFGYVVLGVLRAMADDYGALVFLEHQGEKDRVEMVSIELLETGFAEGREFALAQAG